jgi:Zn-dependent peptidase ImmA (M78 family)
MATMADRVHQFGEAALARAAARELQRAYPYFFDQIRVPILDLARALHLRVEERTNLRQRAQLEIRQASEGNQYSIVIRSGLEQNVRRFAAAHEIGHFILHERHRYAIRSWDSQKQERFANLFAADLLLSITGREHLDANFAELRDPADLLRMASDLGLTPYALLTTATENRPLASGQDKIWLRIKYVVNETTNLEPKLRIVSAHYDRDRYFIPTNQSIATFAGADSWLSFAPLGTTCSYDASIKVKLKRPEGFSPKFLPASVQASLSAVRLRPSANDESYFIILARVKKAEVQPQFAVS